MLSHNMTCIIVYDRFTGAVNTPSSRLLSTPDPEDDMNDLEGGVDRCWFPFEDFI